MFKNSVIDKDETQEEINYDPLKLQIESHDNNSIGQLFVYFSEKLNSIDDLKNLQGGELNLTYVSFNGLFLNLTFIKNNDDPNNVPVLNGW